MKVGGSFSSWGDPVRREANYHLSKTPDTTASSSTSNVMGIVPEKEPSPKRYLFLEKKHPAASETIAWILFRNKPHYQTTDSNFCFILDGTLIKDTNKCL